MRIAWFGPARDTGGVPGMGALLLESVLERGAQVDLYTNDDPSELPARLAGARGLRVIRSKTSWQWGRWYSRRPFAAFVSGTMSRARRHGRLCRALLEENARRPYDCIFQLSQLELLGLRRHVNELPPIVVYPCVHAAGELHWHRRESAYARQSEGLLMHYVVRLVLTYRSFVQKRDARRPAFIVGMSRRFNEIIARDYGVSPRRQAVLYDPIRMSEPAESSNRDVATDAQASPSPASPASPRPVKLLYVARLSVRKGLDQIVELTRRLDDLHGRVQIEVIGCRRQWSDYSKHLRELNPRVARFVGELKHEQTMTAYEQADGLLLPSLYEPGGLVVGEALSRGACVVASDAVGSAELLSRPCCRSFPAGDLGAFEQEVRRLVQEIERDPAALRERAKREAWRHFSPRAAADQLLSILGRAARQRADAGARVAPTAPTSAWPAAAPLARTP